MKRILFILAVFLLFSCSLDERPVVIGIVPSETPDKLRHDFRAVEKYLEKEMKCSIEVYVPKDYRELISAMDRDEVDIGLYGPFSYIIADSRQELKPLLVRKKKESGITYNSIIIVSADSEIQDIGDLNGKKIAFVNSASTSGYIIPQSLFLSRNIDQQTYFSNQYFSGSHDISINDVIRGKTDAAAVSKTILKRLIYDGAVDDSEIRVIWESEPIPGSPYIARSNLDEKTINAFTEAMLSLHINSPKALEAFDSTLERYVPIDKGLYNSIRNIVNVLGKEFIERNYL